MQRTTGTTSTGSTINGGRIAGSQVESLRGVRCVLLWRIGAVRLSCCDTERSIKGVLTSRQRVRRAVLFDGPDRVPRDLPEPWGSDFLHISPANAPTWKPGVEGEDEWGCVWRKLPGDKTMGQVVVSLATPSYWQKAPFVPPRLVSYGLLLGLCLLFGRAQGWLARGRLMLFGYVASRLEAMSPACIQSSSSRPRSWSSLNCRCR